MLVIAVGYTFLVPRKGGSGGEKLREYRAKRDFAVTAEPEGAAADAGGARFVVQRHRARRLHYDFRLEVDGALASWAVPRGPSLDPAARQLAVHVEDHPVEYADFEGVIPRGQYGGGDVIVWDRGTWTPAHTDDPATAIRDGELHFDLAGEKLAGRFALIRRGRTGKDEWLLVHKNDEHARHGWTADDHPRSVLSGRTNDEVAAAPAALWQSGLPAAEAEVRLGAGAWEPPTGDELAALDAIRRNDRWSVAGRDVKLTNLDKVLFPGRDGEAPVTKRELVRHYATVGPLLLPYLAGRPVNMHRFPEGVGRPGFWQQELPAGTPDWVRRWHDDHPGPGTAEWRVLVDGVPTLAWLANLAAVELHPWTGRLPEVRRPAWALIDIDPGTRTTFDQVLVLARLFRTALRHLGVAGMPKVTGQRGVQIWVPVAPGYTYSDTRGWVEKVSKAVGSTVPELVSWEWTKDRRGGRARLDYTQNVVNKTLVAPWSVRPQPGAPVSVPITWEELDDPDLAPDRWTVRDVPDRVHEVGDPLAPLIGRAQKLPSL
ncbi:MAG: ATP-dependent DNA ligase [Pseudonocardia sp.]|nr:ATP-dependent DNA ligase [Pseudonocardia sp.]